MYVSNKIQSIFNLFILVILYKYKLIIESYMIHLADNKDFVSYKDNFNENLSIYKSYICLNKLRI